MRKLICVGAALALAFYSLTPVFAAVSANSIVTAQTPNLGVVKFVQGTDAADTDKTLYTCGSNGCKCLTPLESNTDTTATHLVTVSVQRSSTDYQLVAFTTGLGDGTVTALPAKAAFAASLAPMPTDSDSNAWITMNTGDTLVAQYHSALTTSTAIKLVAPCFDF